MKARLCVTSLRATEHVKIKLQSTRTELKRSLKSIRRATSSLNSTVFKHLMQGSTTFTSQDHLKITPSQSLV